MHTNIIEPMRGKSQKSKHKKNRSGRKRNGQELLKELEAILKT